MHKMRPEFKTILALAFALLYASCIGTRDGDQFASYQRDFLGKTQIGSAITKEIILQNPSTDSVQHIRAINFDTNANPDGHFRIDKVEVGGIAQNPRDKDITIPAGSMLQIFVTYQPLNLNTSIAHFGGWYTGEDEPYVPGKPVEEETAVKMMKELAKGAKGDSDEKEAIHRSMIIAIYDRPQEGMVQIELVGEAVPGPNGEIAGVGGGGDCPADGGILCYKGGFAMELPDIMTTGPKQLEMGGPVVFKLSGNNVEMDLATFPAELLILKGNGPGEPLEGKPISAISLVINGPEGVTATGTFDGTNLNMNGMAFRIRVVLAK